MGLISLIDDKNSELSEWMEWTFDRRAITRLVSEINNLLDQQPLLLIEHNQYGLVGTAFDYLFRWQFGPLNKAVASDGALLLQHQNQRNALSVVDTVIESGNRLEVGSREQAEYAVILAWFEAVFRSPRWPRELLLALQQRTTREVIVELRTHIQPQVLDDLLLLCETIPSVWEGALAGEIHLNPIFAGSRDVGGADADWIINGVLYDCKVSKRQRPFSRREVLQVLGYVLLDYNDTYGIHSIGWYYARQQLRLIYPLTDIMQRLNVAKSLQALRNELHSIVAIT